MLLLSREFASPGMSASADRFSHWLMLGHHDVYWGCTSLAQEMMVAYASLISRNLALPSPRRRASRKCLGNMWGEMKESKKSHVSFGSRTLAWDTRMKSWWRVNSWMRSRTGFPSALREGQQQGIHCLKIRFGCMSFYISFVSGHKAIYIYHHGTGGWQIILSEFIPEATLLEFERRVRVLKTFFLFGCAFGTPSVVSWQDVGDLIFDSCEYVKT